MTPEFADFLVDLRAVCSADVADGLERAHRNLSSAAGYNHYARSAVKGFDWIARQPRTAAEKRDAIRKLLELPPGPRIVSMRMLTGWAA